MPLSASSELLGYVNSLRDRLAAAGALPVDLDALVDAANQIRGFLDALSSANSSVRPSAR